MARTLAPRDFDPPSLATEPSTNHIVVMETSPTRSSEVLAPTAVLTTVVDLSRVKSAEDLPPSVAADLGGIVATHVGSWGETIRTQAPKQFGFAAALGTIAWLFPSSILTSAAVGGFIGSFFGVAQMKRQAPLLAAHEHLKSLGVGFRARRRIVKRLREIVGTFPARDPAARPAGGQIAAMLNPTGEEMGRQSALPAPQRASSLDEVPEGVARVVCEQHMVFRRRFAWVFGGLGGLTGAYAISLAVRGSSRLFMLLGLVVGVQMLFSWLLARGLVRRQLRAPLVSLGLTKAQANEGLKALGPARRAVKRDLKRRGTSLAGDVFVDELSAAWRDRLGSGAQLGPPPEGPVADAEALPRRGDA